MLSVAVSVVVDGRLISGAGNAQIRHGVVSAPLDPYALSFVTAIDTGERGRIVLRRWGRTIVISLGSRTARVGAHAVKLPIAPYLRAGEPIIPLAAVARALGAAVTYRANLHTLDVEMPAAPPLATPTPPGAWSHPDDERPTFTPYEAPTPAPTVSGIPHPRRTPILVPPT